MLCFEGAVVAENENTKINYSLPRFRFLFSLLELYFLLNFLAIAHSVHHLENDSNNHEGVFFLYGYNTIVVFYLCSPHWCVVIQKMEIECVLDAYGRLVSFLRQLSVLRGCLLKRHQS